MTALNRTGGFSLDIAVVGRFPPPIGGVSVFVERKYESLRPSGAGYVDLGSKCWILDVVKLAIFTRCLFLLNTTNFAVLLIFFLLGVLGRARIYDHNSSRHYWGRKRKELIYLFFVRRAESVCVVHQHLVGQYESRGVELKILVESPFLPPVEAKFREVVETYPQNVLQFLNESSCFRMALSASKYAHDSHGRDLYGIKNLVELVSRLRQAGVEIKCLLAVADWREEMVPECLKADIRKLERSGDLVFMVGQYEFWPIYRYLDCFLRLTSTDGDSVSVKEALHYGCPVVATDVVPRPDGVVLFPYADIELLSSRVLALISRKCSEL